MKLYAQYIKEVCGTECVFDDESFYTYKIDENKIYLENVYISKESRNTGKVDEIVEEVYRLGKEKGCRFLTSSVCKLIFEDNQERSKHILKRNGFEKFKEDEYMEYYFKEIN